MLEIVSGINSSTWMWYASRATGVVLLVLLTLVMLLGLLVTRQGRLPGLPKFAVTGLHRNLSLLAVAFVLMHVLTAVFDGYVHIPLTAAVIPLASPYERLWIGLGAVAFDLTLAVIVTSLLRRHLSRKLWRGVHLLVYVSWPVAWVHSVWSGKDLQHGALLVLAIGCLLAIVAGLIWRLASAARDVPRAERVSLLMAAIHHRSGAQDKGARERTAVR